MRQKVTCVFVHGWAMNSAVWQPLIAQLPDWLEVICVDLPGHGGMEEVQAGSLQEQAELLAAVSQKPALWIGWSLAGLMVLKLAAMYPARVAGVFAVASTPSFVCRPDWSPAVDASVFTDFAAALENDVVATLRRFLALQVIGDAHALKTVRKLQIAMQERGQASPQALRAGLQILLESDLRRDLSILECPLHWHLGTHDTLVPISLTDHLRLLNPAIDISIEVGAGHAPFLSHPEKFRQELLGFVGKIYPGLV